MKNSTRLDSGKGCELSLNAAFSLVELSIVLVIIGLLVASIVVGQSLIQSAKIRAAITQLKNYETATLTFKEKYSYFPGDFPNATNFWPAKGAAGTSGIYNGNGDDYVLGRGLGTSATDQTSCTRTNETSSFWAMLWYAGLLEQKIMASNATAADEGGPAGTTYYPGINAPAFPLEHSFIQPGSCVRFSDDAVLLGGSSPGTLNPFAFTVIDADNAGWGVLSAVDVYNIDKKIDDGQPTKGRVLGTKGVMGQTNYCTVGSSYNLAPTQNGCVLVYRPWDSK